MMMINGVIGVDGANGNLLQRVVMLLLTKMGIIVQQGVKGIDLFLLLNLI